jgi:mRNA interferase RelE/StbE
VTALRWRVEIDPRALRDLRRIDRGKAREILSYINERILSQGDPRQLGKPLQGDLKGFWRYRVGDFRIVARIEDEVLLVMVIAIGHRKEVYR